MKRYYIDRVSDGATVEVRAIGELSTAAAEKMAREYCRRLSRRQAESSIVRLLTVAWEPRRLEPFAAFRKHPDSGRVTRI